MNKIFLSANDLLYDSYRLAQQVYESGFRPNFIIGVWRGGAPVGIAVQEFLEYVGVPSDHIAIRTSSYRGIEQQEKVVRVHGLQYIIENVNAEDEVLLVDDVFDTGRSLRATLAELREKCRRNLPSTIRIACPWFKPNKNVTDIKPDFYVHETDDWLVFPHELKGLSLDEICAGKGHIADPLAAVLRDRDRSTG
ncbi:hypoxanthine phosphoribosyltransferase [Mangrovimicrobium sediminis]|uniref:Hypoxanthine phosphoribosyltransferase n=1 Tax=Mangrovimicrobium sediminis TaxID=2562682 RepID=A0A4Z0M4L8_9GAMM|nr:phosphoribosyltransferase family protein [Haliea sp. SAOS-164]TGD74633.1 hypoxanthine phosphoribosyltransferase [Haliea sp. SAOS-164]